MYLKRKGFVINKKPTYEELEKQVNYLESKLALVPSLEENIKINNSFLAILFDTIPNPVFYKDINGCYQHCNDAFAKNILGLSKEEIIGKTLYELPASISKEQADIYYEKDSELLSEPSVQFYEGLVLCSDKKSRNFNFYKSSFVVNNEILGLVGIMLDVSDYKSTLKLLDEKNEVLNSLSITDWLTSLYNRRYFEDIFNQKISSLNRSENKFSFAIIDIDYFKYYNDAFGHHEGDVVLKKISKTIKETFNRPTDYIFRLGGEEFGVLFDVEKSSSAIALMEDLKNKIENLKIECLNPGINPYVTVSIGLGNVKKVEFTINSSSLYHKIDDLLYSSKNNGRNKVTSKDILM